MALYVYGLMRAREARAAVQSAEGNPPVDLVESGGLAALVTEISESAARLRRESVTGHAGVLQAAFEHGPLLPLRFGTVMADSDAVIQDLLIPRAQTMLARLDALEGKAEILVKATYLEEPLLRSILENDRSLRRAVERMRSLPPAATHFERVRIGEAIAGAVASRREVDAQAMVGELRPLAVAMRVSEPHHERTALNASFLVERSNLEQFDAAVEHLSESHAGRAQFKLIGPMPAHSFADQEWEAAPTRADGGIVSAWV
jgi:hypothetical protein